jgi:regulator-associated protein of mTOR
VKKLCISCRRNAKNERVLLHYNGHGVPRPTANGEIWVFNKSYTQYIPLSIFDLQSWTGTPAIYVFDCSAAGLIVDAFSNIAKQQRTEHALSNGEALQQTDSEQTNTSSNRAPRVSFANMSNNSISTANIGAETEQTSDAETPTQELIILASCGSGETLPQSADMPADVFTACLTTPMKMALLWFCASSPLKLDGITPDLIDKIPGQQNNRKTPLGELNWIFTAITDTIAWNVLPRTLFQKLFRQDLLVASLFRNYLLAERILRANNCTPMSKPELPPTYQHPMWQAWDR